MCLCNTNAPGGNKSKFAFFSTSYINVMVEVTTLTLVSFERVSLVEYTCQI